MATSACTYDALLQTMKNHFTVVDNSCSYTLGGYMRAKAAEQTAGKYLPASMAQRAPAVIHHFLDTINEKLRVKETPPPEKTLTSFPIRTVFSSLAASLVLCSLVFSFAFLGTFGNKDTLPVLQTAESQMEVISEDELVVPYFDA